MDGITAGAIAALWLGVLTSVSPCPLATNIAAVSYIGRRVGNMRNVLLSGVLYTLGRVIAYLAVGIVVVAGLLSIPQVSLFLQRHMHRLLGPVLVITGFLLLDIVRISMPGAGVSERMRQRVDKSGVWGAGLLGMVFALTFCPVSAGLFFGSLIPLALRHGSTVLLPSLYGIGTGLPVLLFALLFAFSARSVGAAFRVLTRVERWVRRATGIVFVVVGVYLIVKYIFNVPLPF